MQEMLAVLLLGGWEQDWWQYVQIWQRNRSWELFALVITEEKELMSKDIVSVSRHSFNF